MDGEQESVLATLLRFSKPYAWLIKQNCPDEKLNRELTMLRNLKSNDFAPLVLYLIDRLNDNSLAELIQIVRLIVDYLLRMRIASPATGSGTTRSLSFELIRKMRDGGEDAIPCSFESLLFELSNSPTVSSEFISDENFAVALQGNFYHVYARELLLRIEEHETKDIPVDISQVTVEHLMPQTLSNWWVDHLGGGDEAERVRLAYTNTVGNYAIVSQGYNSSMSNRPWNEKRDILRDVQFRVTREVAEKDEWGESGIIVRGLDLADRAIEAITSPLPRTRNYRSRVSIEVGVGLYPLLFDDETLVGTSIHAVVYNGESMQCLAWNRLLSVVGYFLHKENPALFAEAANDSVWYSMDKSEFDKPFQVPDSPWFCGGSGNHGKTLRNIAARISDAMGFRESFLLEVVNPLGDD